MDTTVEDVVLSTIAVSSAIDMKNDSTTVVNSINSALTDTQSPQTKPRLNVNKEIKVDRSASGTGKNKDRWRNHRMTEDYVNLVGDLMYPKLQYGPYGYIAEEGRFPVERITTLGYLLNPLRRPTVFEKWNPIEICVFEASITVYGKNFNMISKRIKTKSVKEVIEFYYDWKKTSHYKQWKKNYIFDSRDLPESLQDT